MPKQKKTLEPSKGDHVQAPTLPITIALPMPGSSPTWLHSPGLQDAEGFASLALSDRAATFQLETPQQVHTLASSPVFEFPIFEDLVGEGELDSKVVVALNLNPTVGEVVCPLVAEGHVPSLTRSVRKGIASALPTNEADRAPTPIGDLGGVVGGTPPRHKDRGDEMGANSPP